MTENNELDDKEKIMLSEIQKSLTSLEQIQKMVNGEWKDNKG